MPVRGYEPDPVTKELLLAVRNVLEHLADIEDDYLVRPEQRLLNAEQDFLIKNAVA